MPAKKSSEQSYMRYLCSSLLFFLLLIFQAELQKLEQQKQQSVDEMRDRKTYMERTVEMKRDERQKKQQELKNITEELQRLQDSCSRLQELENKLAEVVRMHTHTDHDVFEVVKSSQVDFFDIIFFWIRDWIYHVCLLHYIDPTLLQLDVFNH